MGRLDLSLLGGRLGALRAAVIKNLAAPLDGHIDHRIRAAWSYGAALIAGGEYPDVAWNRAVRFEILDSGEG